MIDNKVYYNPDITPFIYKMSGLTFYFSSNCSMERFKRIYEERLERNNLKIQSMYKVKGDFTIMLLIYYYKLAENRFFRVEYLGKTLEKEYNIKLEII